MISRSHHNIEPEAKPKMSSGRIHRQTMQDILAEQCVRHDIRIFLRYQGSSPLQVPSAQL